MTTIPLDNRQAFFVCVLVYLRHPQDPMPLIAIGKMHGIIHHQSQGKGGFGYDPVFFLPDYRCTAAELTPEQKNSISHRGKALQRLIKQLYD